MAKPKAVWACSDCGRTAPKWVGLCPGCGGWSTYQLQSSESAPAPAPGEEAALAPITQAPDDQAAPFSTGSAELDRILGGGAVPGSIALVAGEPGIGKSTLLLQAALHAADAGATCLYVAGEESPSRLRLRAARLGKESERLYLTSDTRIESVLAAARRLRPALLIVDSIQTLKSSELPTIPGKPAQIEACTRQLVEFVATSQAAVFIVGHVTKNDEVAGPRSLEHLCDQVFTIEGERHDTLRWVRSVKNRFGPTQEVALFRMGASGLSDVADASAALLAERPAGVAGSVVVPVVQGTRVLLTEVQALLAPAKYTVARVKGRGVSLDRAELVAAVLETRFGLQLSSRDMFLNIVGGLRVEEPALDLGLAVAMVSSLVARPVSNTVAVGGEIGFAGELRSVTNQPLRRKECHRSGFDQVYLPGGSEGGNVRSVLARLGLVT